MKRTSIHRVVSRRPVVPHRSRRRNLHVAVHGEDRRPGRLRLRLDARHGRRRRRTGQARHRRRQPEVEELRQGRRSGVGGRPQRGAPHRASPTTAASSGRPRSIPAASSSSTSHTDPAKPKLVQARSTTSLQTSGGVVGPHTQLCAAGPHAADGAFEQQGPRRPYRDGRIHQRRRVHRDALDADRRRAAGRREDRQVRRWLRLRRARAAAPQRARHLVVHRLEQLHDEPRQADGRRRKR